MGVRSTAALSLSVEHALQLQRWAGDATDRSAARAQAVLYAAQGLTIHEIATVLKVDRGSVSRWLKRFMEQGPQGLCRVTPRPAPSTDVENRSHST